MTADINDSVARYLAEQGKPAFLNQYADIINKGIKGINTNTQPVSSDAGGRFWLLY